MRVAWLVAAVLASMPAAAHAAGPLRPPVITESFTPLPCPARRQSTVALEGCAEQALLGGDRRIDRATRRIFGQLRTRDARLSFARGERAWLRYRRASCSAEASAYAGGSAAPLLFLQCEIRRNRTHLADISAALRTLSRPR